MAFSLRPETLDFIDRAPIIVREAVTIEAPPARVWAAFGDAAVWPQWFAALREARYTSPGPVGVGTRRFVDAQGLRVDETLLAFEPERRYAFRVDAANLPVLSAMVELVELEPLPTATRVVYRQALELRWWLSPVAGLVRGQMARALRQGLAGLGPWVAAQR